MTFGSSRVRIGVLFHTWMT